MVLFKTTNFNSSVIFNTYNLFTCTKQSIIPSIVKINPSRIIINKDQCQVGKSNKFKELVNYNDKKLRIVTSSPWSQEEEESLHAIAEEKKKMIRI